VTEPENDMIVVAAAILSHKNVLLILLFVGWLLLVVGFSAVRHHSS